MSTALKILPHEPCFWQNKNAPGLYIYEPDRESRYEATCGFDTSDSEDFDDFEYSDDELDSDDLVYSEEPELLTDARPDDKFIILRERNACRCAKSCQTHTGSLSDRISVSCRCGSARFFRCSQTDFPDFVEWLGYQRGNAYKIYGQPSHVVLEEPQAISKDDFIRCRSLISLLLQTQSIADVQVTLLTCYFVANSLRNLGVRELASAVHETAKTRYPRDSDFVKEANTELREQKLLRLIRAIIRLDKRLEPTFILPSMKRFLQCVSLPGVERGHGTMAQLCLGEIRRFGSTLIVKPWHRFRRWFSSCSDWPLMSYATKYWSCHVREASIKDPGVTAEVYQLINHGVADTSPSRTPVHLQSRVVDIGLATSKIYDLPRLTEFYLNLGAIDGTSLVNPPTDDEWQTRRRISFYPISSADHASTTAFDVTRKVRTEILPEFDALHINTQEQSTQVGENLVTSDTAPEDGDWESVNGKEYHNGWDIVTREDYAMR